MERAKLHKKSKPPSKEGSVKINKTFVDSQPFREDGGRYFYDSSLTGFGVYIGKTCKSYFAEGTIRGSGGNTTRITIGKHGVFTPTEAREAARGYLRQMSLGVDPMEERKKAVADRQQEEREAVTLKEIWEQYKTARPTLKESTLYDYNLYITSPGALGDWIDRPIKSITKDEVELKHQEIGRNAGKSYANTAMSFLKAVLNFAKARERLESNPVDRLSATKAWFPEKARQIVIRENKLPLWFRALDHVGENCPLPSAKVGVAAFEFLLLTGLRKSEALELPWSRISFDDRLLEIPDTKSGNPHALPLSDYLLEFLHKRKEEAGNSEWVFPSTKRKCMKHLVEPQPVLDVVCEEFGDRICLHDLRRTFITTAESLDISSWAIKWLLNHKSSGDVTATYYLVKAIKRLREPMQRITDYFVEMRSKGLGLKLVG